MTKRKEDKKFEYFWDNIINPVIMQAFDDLDKDFVRNNSAEIKDLKVLKINICDDYHSYRERFKEVYHRRKNEAKWDLFKISSIMCYSIIKNKPIRFDNEELKDFYLNENLNKDSQYIINNHLINYKIAFRVALGFVYVDMLYEYLNKCSNSSNEIDMRIYQTLKKHSKLEMYKYNSNSDNDSVEEIVIKDLAINDIYERDFDFLMFTALMVGVKEYNEALIKSSL